MNSGEKAAVLRGQEFPERCTDNGDDDCEEQFTREQIDGSDCPKEVGKGVGNLLVDQERTDCRGQRESATGAESPD